MLNLDSSLSLVPGIGPQTAAQLAAKKISTILDLLLWLPLRYDDRSQTMTIDQLRQTQPTKPATIQVTLTSIASHYRGRRSTQSATAHDETGSIKLTWFNSPWVKTSLKPDQPYFVSGKLSSRGTLTQPTVEAVSTNQLHTGRLVPLYPTIPGLSSGKLRRLLHTILDQLPPTPDHLAKWLPTATTLNQLFYALHFPDQADQIISGRERLALEEMISLMYHAAQLKALWSNQRQAPQINRPTRANSETLIPSDLPFTLTQDQLQAIQTILRDLEQPTPMNRLLIGDVGSGKTVVAGAAAQAMINAGHSVCLVAPTQILTHQHDQTFARLFPHLPKQLVTSHQRFALQDQPTCYIGTHALLTKLDIIQPGLIIYDEQHRFGVSQRQNLQSLTQLSHVPHVLTMTATPIPRSLMLTIFNHLSLSTISELPSGRQPTTTWLVPPAKHEDGYRWLFTQLADQSVPRTAIIVCPFISPSTTSSLEQVPSVDQVSDQITQLLPPDSDLRIGVLHSQLPIQKKDQVTTALYNNQLDILVTTPVIEVGLDVPTATYIIITGAERFGLASLHQLRGRVGRAGQQGYCLLMTSPGSKSNSQRLKFFAHHTDGMTVAEYDLKNRGAGDIFGTQQHGFDQLKFSAWTDLHTIAQARTIFEKISLSNSTWQSFLPTPTEQNELVVDN